MPRKIENKEEEFDEEGDEEEEEEDDESEEEAPVEKPVGRGRPRKAPPVPRAPVRQAQQVAPQKRYAWVVQQAAEALVDTETNEVIASDIGAALADIISRLERIENSIGVMQEG